MCTTFVPSPSQSKGATSPASPSPNTPSSMGQQRSLSTFVLANTSQISNRPAPATPYPTSVSKPYPAASGPFHLPNQPMLQQSTPAVEDSRKPTFTVDFNSPVFRALALAPKFGVNPASLPKNDSAHSTLMSQQLAPAGDDLNNPVFPFSFTCSSFTPTAPKADTPPASQPQSTLVHSKPVLQQPPPASGNPHKPIMFSFSKPEPRTTKGALFTLKAYDESEESPPDGFGTGTPFFSKAPDESAKDVDTGEQAPPTTTKEYTSFSFTAPEEGEQASLSLPSTRPSTPPSPTSSEPTKSVFGASPCPLDVFQNWPSAPLPASPGSQSPPTGCNPEVAPELHTGFEPQAESKVELKAEADVELDVTSNTEPKVETEVERPIKSGPPLSAVFDDSSNEDSDEEPDAGRPIESESPQLAVVSSIVRSSRQLSNKGVSFIIAQYGISLGENSDHRPSQDIEEDDSLELDSNSAVEDDIKCSGDCDVHLNTLHTDGPTIENDRISPGDDVGAPDSDITSESSHLTTPTLTSAFDCNEAIDTSREDGSVPSVLYPAADVKVDQDVLAISEFLYLLGTIHVSFISPVVKITSNPELRLELDKDIFDNHWADNLIQEVFSHSESTAKEIADEVPRIALQLNQTPFSETFGIEAMFTAIELEELPQAYSPVSSKRPEHTLELDVVSILANCIQEIMKIRSGIVSLSPDADIN
ncbi:hypothetical protein PTNB73_05417 [Pyrenophora teres f. teres]|nr:hypothetical protein HRS9139_05013 [Pyrenophora teres f. teres]KAE8841037.1 hypothetical protein PTNB85_04436 [Pyrenophora teres f. teres]KAE8848825.1 hypothetical protein HRS9122_02841 [Pyrenophora teres f. teres]KAE8864534.1 hypothetical protein PTNB29_04498 [Pyrenophora teres f. teres]KAE8867323.1 hypothetical protein PTNB73_05417 [Pyrenophora teres f. teres]